MCLRRVVTYNITFVDLITLFKQYVIQCLIWLNSFEIGNIFFKTNNVDKEIIAKHAIVIDETYYSDQKNSYLNTFGKTYYLGDCGHDVLMLYIEMKE